MGAALHLAEVHQAPPGPKRKRKGGGGGGDGYDKLVCRVYRDPQMTPEARELILLLAWLVARDPDRLDQFGEPKGKVWSRAAEILGDYPTWSHRKGSRLADLIDADRPRYEPDKRADIWQQRLCSAPMIRRAGECGQHAVNSALRVDPETGWRTPVWYCNRHRDYGRAAEAAFRNTSGVEPIPNAGGLMPSYLSNENGDEGWIKLYRRASDWARSRWEPPVMYGLRADKWPRPGEERVIEVVEPPRLRLAALDGELIGGGA